MAELLTYSAADIAKYFRALTNPEDGDLLTNLKLQKLCYYAQGVGLATRGHPLFSERLEAWLHGPVVPSLYGTYKEYGSNEIPPPVDFDSSIFHAADLSILNDVYDEYGQYSGWKLRDMTHQEPPWINAYNNEDSKVITPEALLNYFSGEITDTYVESYRAKVQA